MNTLYIGYEPWRKDLQTTRNGVLVASDEGKSTTYGLDNAQGRGTTLIDPGTMVYEGMIVGSNTRPQDMAVNVCKEKKKTNMRSSTSDIAVKLQPSVKLSLEQSLDFVGQDELVEVTPQNIRLRKKLLTQQQRLRSIARSAAS